MHEAVTSFVTENICFFPKKSSKKSNLPGNSTPPPPPPTAPHRLLVFQNFFTHPGYSNSPSISDLRVNKDICDIIDILFKQTSCKEKQTNKKNQQKTKTKTNKNYIIYSYSMFSLSRTLTNSMILSPAPYNISKISSKH